METQTIKRYVVRQDNLYYNGNNTWTSPTLFMDDFSKAKIFKNIVGAKTACGFLYNRGLINLEIVEIETKPTDNVIHFEYRGFRNRGNTKI